MHCTARCSAGSAPGDTLGASGTPRLHDGENESNHPTIRTPSDRQLSGRTRASLRPQTPEPLTAKIGQGLRSTCRISDEPRLIYCLINYGDCAVQYGNPRM